MEGRAQSQAASPRVATRSTSRKCRRVGAITTEHHRSVGAFNWLFPPPCSRISASPALAQARTKRGSGFPEPTDERFSESIYGNFGAFLPIRQPAERAEQSSIDTRCEQHQRAIINARGRQFTARDPVVDQLPQHSFGLAEQFAITFFRKVRKPLPLQQQDAHQHHGLGMRSLTEGDTQYGPQDIGERSVAEGVHHLFIAKGLDKVRSEQRPEQCLLGIEVIVDGAMRDPGAASDLREFGAGKAVERKLLQGCRHDLAWTFVLAALAFPNGFVHVVKSTY